MIPKVLSSDDPVTLWSCHLDYTNRYASAAELADELVRFLGGEPILARPSAALEGDATTGRQTALLKHESSFITSVAYSRDGRRLATRERAVRNLPLGLGIPEGGPRTTHT